jgi:non-specific serine/threonine protein kinase/serine/threonine-protein kinase
VLTGHAAHTRLGSFVGTPAYSSPEQVSGPLVNVDTRADIYSLGVVLYQLLAGVTPYSEEELNRKTQAELARLLSGERPPSLLARFSSLSVEAEGEIARHRSLSIEQMKALLGSDLSWIIGKCLQSDPDDRYPSVLELEKDLRRWLNNEPIEARPASRMYRMRKFVRRHRVGAALASVMTLALLTTTAAAVVGFVRAEDARAEAEMAADFQVKQMQSIDPATMGISLRSALIKAVEEQGSGRGGDPAGAAQRRQQLETLLKGVNMTDLALTQLDSNSLQPALATIKKDFGDSPLLQARLWQTMANTLVTFGQYEAAVEPQRLALEQRRQLLGAEHPLTLDSLSSRGFLGCQMSQYKQAEVDLQAATAGLRRVLGSDDPATLNSIKMTAGCLQSQGTHDKALPLFREAYERRRRTLGHGHPHSLVSARDLAAVLMESGNSKEALPYAEEAMNGFRRMSSELADRNEEMPNTTSVLASVYTGLGRHAESETLAREAVEAARQVWGEKHPKTLIFYNNWANALTQLGRPAEAEIYLRQVLETKREILGDDHEDVLVSQYGLAGALAQQGKKIEAEQIYRDIIAEQKRLFGEDHLNTSYPIFHLAHALKEQGEFDEAEVLFTQVSATWRRVYGNEARYTLVAMCGLASVLLEKGETGAAKALLQDAVKIQRRTLGDLDEDTVWSLSQLAAVARKEGNLKLAETYLREALTGYRHVRGDEHESTLITIEELIDVLRERGALDEAATLELELKKARQRAPSAKE